MQPDVKSWARQKYEKLECRSTVLNTYLLQFLNGAGQSSKDRVALSMIEIVRLRILVTSIGLFYDINSTPGRRTGYPNASFRRYHLRRHIGINRHLTSNPRASKRILSSHVRVQHPFEPKPNHTDIAISCMPSDQAIEKSNLLLKLGAIVDRVPPAPIVEKDNFVNRARALARAHTASSTTVPLTAEEGDQPETETLKRMARGRGFFADQFENEANWRTHYYGTGPELYAQCDGRIDAFVAGAGTGGTISGVARFLKPLLPNITVVLADPQGSGLYNRVRYGVMFDLKEREGTRRRRQIDTIVEGIGINRVTANFEAGKELVDDAVRVTDAQALAMARWLVEKDGIFIGSSSAVNCEFFYAVTRRWSANVGVIGFAAVKTAMKLGPGHRIVTVLSDSGSRHLSRFWAKAGDVGGAVDTKLEDVLNARDEDFQ